MSESDWIEQYNCPKCSKTMNLGMGHRLNLGWEGVWCPNCGYQDPPLRIHIEGE